MVSGRRDLGENIAHVAEGRDLSTEVAVIRGYPEMGLRGFLLTLRVLALVPFEP